ncbi:uncharacterized protein BT62DRAFT_924556 [Guyanagaster necrorhizus]|uniref:Uncharacterized protein n=1 Tax=Guyanagaster necrorhizus TaxID=856835 RepID=A0A9P8ALC8_9AGAR|nr:uncharacterized protein BT62DRAFT_924556 [Guyanagaster necrorhizus MCA 3950]KAG7439655.1 hypothetical protein BT62DRAFT_924556 [Guyanagaster necrorhizus MCA 3950]
MLRIVSRYHHHNFSRSYFSAGLNVPILSATRRSVRVQQLPDGYDVSEVVGILSASPVEAIIPSQDHISLRFFARTLAKMYRQRHFARLYLEIDGALTPPLSAFTIAALGRYRLSLNFVIDGLPEDMGEEELKELLFKGKKVVSWRLEGTSANVHLFSLHQVMRVRLVLEDNLQFKHCRMSFIDEDDYLYPEWYSRPEKSDADSKRCVIIDNILTPQTSVAVRDWVNFYDKQGTGLVYGALRPEQNMMRLRFASPGLAGQFIAKFQDRAARLNVRLALVDHAGDSSMENGEILNSEEHRTLLTAISMGACRTLLVQFDKSHHVEKSEYRAFFGQFGSTTMMSEQKWPDEFRLLVQYEDVHDAMQAIVSLSIPDQEHMYEGASVNFLGADHLQPVFIVNSASKSILYSEESDL